MSRSLTMLRATTDAAALASATLVGTPSLAETASPKGCTDGGYRLAVLGHPFPVPTASRLAPGTA
jgi:hypothetical protein